MDENTTNLDVEFKRYVQITRPYLVQLIDEDAIQLCEAWMQRLSNCSEKEKPMRNRYIFILCYQLAKGMLDVPFLKLPPTDELPPISEIAESDCSTEVEYIVIDPEENNAKALYNNNNQSVNDSEYPENEFDKGDNRNSNKELTSDEKGSLATRRQTILCYTCPDVMKACAKEVAGEQYEYRANNLIMRLREIKKQNMLLHNELEALKEESKTKPYELCVCDNENKVDICTSANFGRGSSVTVKSLKNKLQEIQDDRQYLLDTLSSLQEQIDNFHEVKKLELEDMDAKHKLEIIKVKTAIREESKERYVKKLEELRQYYDNETAALKRDHETEMQNLKECHEQSILGKDRIIQEKDKELQRKDKELEKKDNLLLEKDSVIQGKDTEIANLKQQLDDKTAKLHAVMNKYLDKSSEQEHSSETIKVKTHDLEKRLNKMEKSKAKCAKFYENKLAYVQREKHLTECSLQLQLVRQRAHVVNEIAEENQAELAAALEKLEAKYKDIVANVQSTAIQRRMQDQIALETILQATHALRHDVSTNHSQFSGKTVTIKHNKEVMEGYDSEISGILRHKGNTNKSYGEESGATGYCLDGDRFGELFERVHIPQRDTGDTNNIKK